MNKEITSTTAGWDVTQALTPHDAAVRRDRATQLSLTLAQELWVVKDRLMLLEAALSSEGRSMSELLDRQQPDAALRASLETERQRFIGKVLAALEQPPDRR